MKETLLGATGGGWRVVLERGWEHPGRTRSFPGVRVRLSRKRERVYWGQRVFPLRAGGAPWVLPIIRSRFRREGQLALIPFLERGRGVRSLGRIRVAGGRRRREYQCAWSRLPDRGTRDWATLLPPGPTPGLLVPWDPWASATPPDPFLSAFFWVFFVLTFEPDLVPATVRCSASILMGGVPHLQLPSNIRHPLAPHAEKRAYLAGFYATRKFNFCRINVDRTRIKKILLKLLRR